MKKVLIVIMDMGLGGAQKSLLSFLQCFANSEAKNEYAIDLMVMKENGMLEKQIPPQITLVQPPKELRWLGTPLRRSLITQHFSLRCLLGELGWVFKSKLKLFPRSLNKQQRLWDCWRNLVPANPEHYHAAISYIDGFTNYYVMEKIHADRKILWLHNEYQKQHCDQAFDRPFYEACDGIVTISEQCRQCFLQAFEQHKEKTYVLENITAYDTLVDLSRAGSCPEYSNTDTLKLLSVGRLNYLKGFDLAIQAAAHLRDAGVVFQWLLVGEGPEHQNLQEMIDQYDLGTCVHLIGARQNPYGYMKACDILVQPSRSEGRSIVLDEAKLLCKPAVVTDYTTVRDTVEHGKSGWIVEMTAEGIAEGICRLHSDAAAREQISAYLRSLPKGNEEEFNRYVDVMLRG